MTKTLKYAAITAVLTCLSQRGIAQGTVLPASIAIDAAGQAVMSFSAMNSSARLEIGAVVFDSAGRILASMRVPGTVAGYALAASGLLVDDRSITIGGCNPAATTGTDFVVARFPHSLPAATGVGDVAEGSVGFALLPSYPNPVRGAMPVTVSFSLAGSAPVRISLLDESGRALAVLRDESFDAGPHTERLTLGDVPAGVYFVEFRSRNERLVQRLLLFR